jgi:hypothetical protein
MDDESSRHTMNTAPIVFAHNVTMMDIFVATMIMKVVVFGIIFYFVRLIKKEEAIRTAAEPAEILGNEPPATRVAVVACPFCETECAASVRKEIVAAQPVYELICWQCHAALPETSLVSLIDPAEWLQRSVGGRR